MCYNNVHLVLILSNLIYFRGSRSPVYSMSYNPAENAVVLCTVSHKETLWYLNKCSLYIISFIRFLKCTTLIEAFKACLSRDLIHALSPLTLRQNWLQFNILDTDTDQRLIFQTNCNLFF